MPETGSLDAVPPGLLLENGDLLFNRTNSPELVGKVGLFDGEASDRVTFASYLVRLRVRPICLPVWLNYLLNSARFWGYARSQALISLHQANLNSTRYSRILVPVPPAEEQQQIVEEIARVTAPTAASAEHAVREIDLLLECRARLIADVVTGKFDVREAAANLPDGPDDEPDDEPDHTASLDDTRDVPPSEEDEA